mmetsp:Transcript_170188/g.540379  ORF Transcript_170188/g.540379 Transcript_170188/m.540379 type:complete len:251 (+) Transcript_170188:76-828(+)
MGQVMDHCAMCSGETVANESSEVQAKMRRVCWVPLESNPEVLNGFAWKVGLPKTWGFVDMYGLDPELLSMVPPGCCAVTLLFQCSPAIARFKEGQRKRIEVEGQKISPDLVHDCDHDGDDDDDSDSDSDNAKQSYGSQEPSPASTALPTARSSWDFRAARPSAATSPRSPARARSPRVRCWRRPRTCTRPPRRARWAARLRRPPPRPGWTTTSSRLWSGAGASTSWTGARPSLSTMGPSRATSCPPSLRS